MYKVTFSNTATKFYRDADTVTTRRINKAVDILKISPWSHKSIKRLSGRLSGYLRFRIGDCRLVYSIEERNKEVIVVMIAKREDIYRRMGRR
jgi:mRNA interferase RelE/StbE